jgi:hypothetical protein
MEEEFVTIIEIQQLHWQCCTRNSRETYELEGPFKISTEWDQALAFLCQWA